MSEMQACGRGYYEAEKETRVLESVIASEDVAVV